MSGPTEQELASALAGATTEAEGWRPEAGDVLVGVLEDVDLGWSDFRGEYPILTIRAGAGTNPGSVAVRTTPYVKVGESVKVHCFHDVLFSRVMTLRPVPGETVGLQFHGKSPHKTKPNQTVSKYTFRVQGRGADAGGLYDRLGTPSRGRTATPGTGGQRTAPPPIPAAPAPDGAGVAEDDIPF